MKTYSEHVKEQTLDEKGPKFVGTGVGMEDTDRKVIDKAAKGIDREIKKLDGVARTLDDKTMFKKLVPALTRALKAIKDQ
jgi:hypothetical protein